VIAAEVVNRIRSLDPPGRFLREDLDPNNQGMWIDIGDERARKKAGQALREDAPDIRAEMGAEKELNMQTYGNIVAIGSMGSIGMGRVGPPPIKLPPHMFHAHAPSHPNQHHYPLQYNTAYPPPTMGPFPPHPEHLNQSGQRPHPPPYGYNTSPHLYGRGELYNHPNHPNHPTQSHPAPFRSPPGPPPGPPPQIYAMQQHRGSYSIPHAPLSMLIPSMHQHWSNQPSEHPHHAQHAQPYAHTRSPNLLQPTGSGSFERNHDHHMSTNSPHLQHNSRLFPNPPPQPPPQSTNENYQRKHILNKFFSEDQQQTTLKSTPKKKREKKRNKDRDSTSSIRRAHSNDPIFESGSSTIFGSNNSDMSALSYLDNVTLTSSGNWIRKSSSTGDSSFAPQDQPVRFLSTLDSTAGATRLSPIGDIPNASTEGSSDPDLHIEPQPLMPFNSRPMNNHESLNESDLLQQSILTSEISLKSSALHALRRSNSFPNIGTLSVSDADMFSITDSGFNDETASRDESTNDLQHRAIGLAPRHPTRPLSSTNPFNHYGAPVRNHRGVLKPTTLGNSNISALTFEHRAAGWDSDEEQDDLEDHPDLGQHPHARNLNLRKGFAEGMQRAQRTRTQSVDSASQPNFALNISLPMSDTSSDIMSATSSWLKPFKGIDPISLRAAASHPNDEHNNIINTSTTTMDAPPNWAVESAQSIFSDMSTDLLALDLADNNNLTFATFRAAAQQHHFGAKQGGSE